MANQGIKNYSTILNVNAHENVTGFINLSNSYKNIHIVFDAYKSKFKCPVNLQFIYNHLSTQTGVFGDKITTNYDYKITLNTTNNVVTSVTLALPDGSEELYDVKSSDDYGTYYKNVKLDTYVAYKGSTYYLYDKYGNYQIYNKQISTNVRKITSIYSRATNRTITITYNSDNNIENVSNRIINDDLIDNIPIEEKLVFTYVSNYLSRVDVVKGSTIKCNIRPSFSNNKLTNIKMFGGSQGTVPKMNYNINYLINSAGNIGAITISDQIKYIGVQIIIVDNQIQFINSLSQTTTITYADLMTTVTDYRNHSNIYYFYRESTNNEKLLNTINNVTNQYQFIKYNQNDRIESSSNVFFATPNNNGKTLTLDYDMYPVDSGTFMDYNNSSCPANNLQVKRLCTDDIMGISVKKVNITNVNRCKDDTYSAIIWLKRVQYYYLANGITFEMEFLDENGAAVDKVSKNIFLNNGIKSNEWYALVLTANARSKYSTCNIKITADGINQIFYIAMAVYNKPLTSLNFYDENNNVIETFNNGKYNSFGYDSNNNVTNYSGNVYSYDNEGHIVTQYDKYGIKTTNKYDDYGNMTESYTYFEDKLEHYNKYSFVNNQNVNDHEFVKKSKNDLIDYSFGYQNHELFSCIINNFTRRLLLYYPSDVGDADLLSSLTFIEPNYGQYHEIYYTYSYRMLKDITLDGATYRYVYDAYKRISQVNYVCGDTTQQLAKYEYLKYNNIETEIVEKYHYSNSEYLSYTYDEYDNLLTVSDNDADGTTLLFTFTYSTDTKQLLTVTNSLNQFKSYEYSSMKNLIKETYSGFESQIFYNENEDRVCGIQYKDGGIVYPTIYDSNEADIESRINSLLKFFYENGIYYTLFKERSGFVTRDNVKSEENLTGNLVCDKTKNEYFLTKSGIVIDNSKKEGLISYLNLAENRLADKNTLKYIISNDTTAVGVYGFVFRFPTTTVNNSVLCKFSANSGNSLQIHYDVTYNQIIFHPSIKPSKSFNCSNYKDGKWHTIMIIKNIYSFKVIIDNDETFEFTDDSMLYIYQFDVGCSSNIASFYGDICMIYVKQNEILNDNALVQLHYCINRYLFRKQFFVDYDYVNREIKYIKKIFKLKNYNFSNNPLNKYEFFPLNNTYKSINNVLPSRFGNYIDITEYKNDNFEYDYNLGKTVLQCKGQILEYDIGFSDDISFIMRFKINKLFEFKESILFQIKDTNGVKIKCSINQFDEITLNINGVSYYFESPILLNTWNNISFTMKRMITSNSTGDSDYYIAKLYLNSNLIITSRNHHIVEPFTNYSIIIGYANIETDEYICSFDGYISYFMYSNVELIESEILSMQDFFSKADELIEYYDFRNQLIHSGLYCRDVDILFNEYAPLKTIKIDENTLDSYRIGHSIDISSEPVERNEIIFDKNGNVTKIKNWGSIYKQYTYDIYNRLISEKIGDSTTTFTYDARGNITSRGSITYQYDSTYKDRLTKYGSKDIWYNNNNQIYRIYEGDNGVEFEWKRNKLITYKVYSGTTYSNEISFEYDENGQRTKKINTTNSTTTTFTYDIFGRLVKEVTGSNVKRFFYKENGELLYYTDNDVKYFYMKNVLGEIIGLVDSNSNVVVQYEYDAWGNTLSITGSLANTIGVSNPFRYKGYYYDVETGLFWLSSRYYSPELCRFISPDSVDYLEPESINGLNLYAYAKNNPIMYYDPSGHSAILVIGLLVGSFIVGAGASVVSQGLTYGWDEINYWQAGVDGLFALGSTALAMTGIGALASAGIGAVAGWSQYAIGSAFHGEDLTLLGSITSAGLGFIGGAISGAGARNSAKIASSMKLTGKGASAIKAITTASNRYLAEEISMKGLQATTRLWGNVALNAVQDAIAPTIRRLMINGAITIAGVTIGTAAVNYGLSYVY